MAVKRSVAVGTHSKARRQPGANTKVPRKTNAGATGNIAKGGGSTNIPLSGAEDGMTGGNQMKSGTP